ncbi:MAG: M28 family peptidase [Bacteroidota bacterium]
MRRANTAIYLIGIGLFLAVTLAWYAAAFRAGRNQATDFDGARALADVQTQVSFGPRIPGTDGHARIQSWMQGELESAGWIVEVQTTTEAGHKVENLVARRDARPPEIILGAHYDTRIFADRDPNTTLRTQPVPGANDGASGVAVLVELARTLPRETAPVWLVFFDAEDNGRIADWDWILGSRAFVRQNPVTPRAVVVVDMVGDSDLKIYMEQNSDAALRAQIWEAASRAGYGRVFIPTPGPSLLDDHAPFVEAGLAAVDIIDFDYPYWHTTQDTPDKVSADSLRAVGATLNAWIAAQSPSP